MSHEELHSPAGNKISIWVIIGYILSFAGGLLGIVIGSIILTGKKTSLSGQVQYMFNKPSRKHGRIILYFGSLILVACILFFLNWLFFEKFLFGRPPK